MSEVLIFGVIAVVLTVLVCSIIIDICGKCKPTKPTTRQDTGPMPLPQIYPTAPVPPQQGYPVQQGLDPYQQAYLIGYYNAHQWHGGPTNDR